MRNIIWGSIIVVIALLPNCAQAQTNPTPFNLSSGDYSFTNWPSTSPAGTYPPNMRFHRGPTQDPTLTAEPNADYTDVYNATAGTRMNGLGADGFSWRNTGTAGNLGAAVLALNTIGVSNVFVSWTGGTVAVDATTREYRIRLQYRVGTSGPFTDVPGPIEYVTSSTAGHSQNFGPTLLPSVVNNQPVVQLRWKYYFVSGTNTRPQLRVDNILVQSNLPGDGTGSASVIPDTLNGGVTGSIQVVYRRNIHATINSLRIIVPSAFDWSRNRADISYTNMTAADTVVGDTIKFTDIVFNADSTVITIANITSPDSTAYYPFRVQSKEHAFADVAPTPVMVVFGLPSAIADVKVNDANGIPLRLGQLVTIRGIITVANEFGSPSYVQDNTGGIAIYGTDFSAAVNVGDEVVVSGKVDPFNGLSELTSPYLHSISSSGNSVAPLVVNCNQVRTDGVGGVEQYEGLLVRLNSVVVRNTAGSPIATWAVSGSGTNYRLIDATDTVDIRVDNNVNFASTPAPQSYFSVIGVVSQYKTSSPFIGGYQIMPRFSSDILASGPVIATSPYESNITSTSMRINWTTVNVGTSRVRYGTTKNYELGVVEPDDIERTIHAVDLVGLQPATIYHVQAFSVSGYDTSAAANLVVSTSSPATATGQINVYFNKSVNTSLSLGENALGNQDLVNRLVTRINNARRSIDASLYSLSGANEGDVIASALIAARSRGVKVRVIHEYDNRNQTGFQLLSSNGVPMITDRYDQVWNGQGLMHNKFFVFDYRGGAPESMWVWTGSWNPTQSGTVSDRQNAIEIQDVALAGAYTAEFNEMWGSSTDTPNQSASRFGGRKTDNTPHTFVIGNKIVKSYFSPSDQTTRQLRTTLEQAQHSVGVALLSFTRQDLADALIAQKNQGDKVRVVLDNASDIGNQYSYLLSNGVDVLLKGGSGLLHHKYAIVDADNVAATQYTITGSHNWSNSAENSNDENTLIVQDRRVANLYLQEFAARYYEAGGLDSIRITSAAIYSQDRSEIDFGTVVVGQVKQDSFFVSNSGNLNLVVSSVVSTNVRFTVEPVTATVLPSESKKFVVTFEPTLNGEQSGWVILTHNAPGSPDTVSLSGFGQVEGAVIQANVDIRRGWNIVSLPVLVSNNDKDLLFPTATTNAFAFEGGYHIKDSLLNGVGYWLKFDSAQTVPITGLVVVRDTLEVTVGWNLIGTISYPVPVSAVQSIPDGIISSQFFGFESGYRTEDTLQPGKGYWVKVSQNGQIVLSNALDTASKRANGGF